MNSDDQNWTAFLENLSKTREAWPSKTITAQMKQSWVDRDISPQSQFFICAVDREITVRYLDLTLVSEEHVNPACRSFLEAFKATQRFPGAVVGFYSEQTQFLLHSETSLAGFLIEAKDHNTNDTVILHLNRNLRSLGILPKFDDVDSN